MDGNVICFSGKLEVVFSISLLTLVLNIVNKLIGISRYNF